MSLPLRERGLKCNFRKVEFPCYSQSLPLRERGLKFCPAWSHQHSGNVAPLAGAWIEIPPVRLPAATLRRRSPCGSVD